MMIERDSKGRILPGSGGRPKGSKNKFPTDLKNKVTDILALLADRILEEHEELPIKESADLFPKLLPFVLPRLSNVESKSDITVRDLLNMSPDQQKEYILALRRAQEDEDE